MSVQFQCPSCSRALMYKTGDETFQVCRHCGGKIIVPSTAIHENELRRPGGVVGPSVEAQRNLRIAEIQSELNAGRKVSAIKLFRDSFSSDLATAKSAVEMMEHGQRIPSSAMSKISREAPIEQKVHGTSPAQPESSVKSAPAIFWLIVSIGIAIAVVFLLDS